MDTSKNITQHKEYDLVIIGSGGSGLMAAIEAKKNGVEKVAIISKVHPMNSHTGAASGGINATLGNVTKDDWRWHLHDTLKGGDGLSDFDACEILCKNAKAAILELDEFGVDFSRDENGKIAQRKYGGQRLENGQGDFAYRACYSKDQTGKTILKTLFEKAKEVGVEFYSEYFVFDLLMDDGKCHGSIALNIASGEVVAFEARDTIIATGGYSQIYSTTTSAAICTGDGTALAFKNGISLKDMEFIQFHPTGIAGQGFLITEASRAEGGYLVNSEGERFMKNYDPQMLELSSRDVVARAIATEIIEGRGVGKGKNGIYLDLSHLDEDIFVNKIPAVVEFAKDLSGVDVRKSPIVIAPSAHYTMGGIPTDLNCRVIDLDGGNIEGLMAVGEAACVSVHGANRLGCNSLLEIVVFGKIAGSEASKNQPEIGGQDHDIFKALAEAKITQFHDELMNKSAQGDLEQDSIEKIKQDLKNINERNLAVFRKDELLKEGLQDLAGIADRLDSYQIESKSLTYNNELIEYLEVKNLYLNSLTSFYCAMSRKESRGSHYNSDHPKKDDENFKYHTIIAINENGELVFAKKGVSKKND